MKRLLSLLVLGALLSSALNAQLWKMRRYEASAGIGTTQFFGDIGGFSQGKNILGFKDISFLQTRINFNGSARYRILSDVSVRLNINFGSFHSTDAHGSNERRAFESRTLFFEPSAIGEYYIIRNKGDKSFRLMKGSSYPLPVRFFTMLDVYFFSGFGGLSSSVKPNNKLEPLMTGSKGFTAVIPAGIGFSLTWSGTSNLGIELGGRYTFSDHIEGYTSKYSKSNDMYYILNFVYTYKIRTTDKGIPVFLSKIGRR